MDQCGADISGSIVTLNPVLPSVVGLYTVTYNVTDGAGNAAVEVTRTVAVVDTALPVITLTGTASVDTECGAAYVDAGATAIDACGGDLTLLITSVSTVNTGVVGSYTVTFNLADASGNMAVQVVRTVNVVDTTPPVITRLGTSPVTVECGSAYSDSGATAADSSAGQRYVFDSDGEPC